MLFRVGHVHIIFRMSLNTTARLDRAIAELHACDPRARLTVGQRHEIQQLGLKLALEYLVDGKFTTVQYFTAIWPIVKCKRKQLQEAEDMFADEWDVNALDFEILYGP